MIWVVGASTTVSLGGLILGGLLLKAGAAGIIGLASVNYINVLFPIRYQYWKIIRHVFIFTIVIIVDTIKICVAFFKEY